MNNITTVRIQGTKISIALLGQCLVDVLSANNRQSINKIFQSFLTVLP